MTISKAELQQAAREIFAEDVFSTDCRQSWTSLVELGWLGVCAPERLGGLALAREAEAVLHFELGRTLGDGLVAAHMAVLDVLIAAQQDDLASRALAGDAMTTSMRLEALEEVGGTVSGRLHAVPGADRALFILVAANDRLVLFPSDIADLEIVETALWDETRRHFAVTLDQVPIDAGVTLAQGASARYLWDRLNAGILSSLAADSVGGADTALTMTLEHLKLRRQFDRPLAMFQALKHRCADMKARIAAAEALLWKRCSTLVSDASAVAEAGAFKANAARLYHHVAEEAMQLHGGIGLTEEYPCHRYLKRALLNGALGGSADIWEEAWGRELVSQLT